MREQFGQIVIPVAVQRELARFDHAVAVPLLDAPHAEGWLTVETAEDLPLVSLLKRTLDPGEPEAITLAATTDADLLLIDEAEGRAPAVGLGLRITGVLGILFRAKREGLLPSLQEEIRRLRDQAHFFVAPALEAQILMAASE